MAPQHAPDQTKTGNAFGAPAATAPPAAPDPTPNMGGGGSGLDPTAFPGGPGGLPPDDTGQTPNDNTSAPLPIQLDLSGRGIAITQLTSSNTFETIGQDGYQHRTAWAGTGNAVLFVDPNNLGTIQNADQYIFTDWDPSAKTDMEALRNVFDTNHDGQLDAGDAAFAQFKLMVTNADGTTSVETLAQAGITAINLTATTTSQSFADGSSIDGETTFTRSNGTQGTVAAVTYAADANGYAVGTTTTVNADHSTTINTRALNPDGSLANATSSTTSADGTTRTLRYDDDGLGVIDRSQTDVTTTDAQGGTVLTVSNADGQGQLTGTTTTTTSADRSRVTIARDLTGGGIVNQTETRQTGAGGSIVDTLADVAANGRMIDETVTTRSADGLGKLTQVDAAGRVDASGNPVFDRTTTDTTVVAGNGSRTETIATANTDGSGVSGTVIHISADGLTRSSAIDRDGNGTTDLTRLSQTTDNADGSVTTTTTERNGAGTGGTVRDVTATTLSADGLSKTTQADMNGDGTFDRTTTDITTAKPGGGQTETVTVTSADGTVVSEVVTSRGPDGVSRVTTRYDQSGNVLSSDAINVGPQGGTTETVSTFGSNGTLLNQTIKSTAAGGLTTNTRTDTAGSGTADRSVFDQTVENADGSATETIGTRSADGTLIGRSVINTSADGLTVVTKVDSTGALNPDGTPVFDKTTTDQTSYTTDGSRIDTVTTTSASGTVLSTVSTDAGAGRQSHSVTTDANGDGFTTTFDKVVTGTDGTTTDSITDLNPDGSKVDGVVRATSANGLSITTKIDAAGTGTANRTTTDVTTIDNTGQRREAVTNTGSDGTVVGRTVTVSQANGSSSSVQVDTTGNGTFDHVAKTATAYNADGTTTITVTDAAANGTTRDQTVTTTSGNGLSTTTQHDLDGNGTADQTTTATTAYAANGAITTTTTDLNGDGSGGTAAIRDQTVSTMSGDGRTMTKQSQYRGSVTFSRTESTVTQVNGDITDTTSTFASPDASGAPLTTTVVTTSGNGLSKTTQVDVNGDSVFDTTAADTTVLNANGSRTETITQSGSAGMNGQTIVTTSGNGLSQTTMSDAAGNGTIDTVTHDDTTLNVDGSRVEVVKQSNQDASLRNSTTVTTSADRKHVSVARVLGTDGNQTETIDRGANGTVTDVLGSTDGTGTALGGETVTTSANGLVKTATYTDAGGHIQDTQTDTRVLNADGSTTEQFSDVDSSANLSAVFKTITSGSGLSKTTSAQFSGLPFANYSTLDTTTLNSDGTLNDTIVTTNADGSTRDTSVRTVSADGMVTSSTLDDTADGNPEITDRKVMAMDGSSVHTTTIFNSATHAQDRQDIVATSADGRTLTLQSARDGDPTVRYTETTVQNPDGTISDKSQFVSGSAAPGYTQIRSQTLGTTGGQTVVISDYDAVGTLEDQTVTTVSGNGLLTQSTIDTTGSGTPDLVLTDNTIINADGSRTDAIVKGVAAGVATFAPGTMGYGRTIVTSADGLTVTTSTDDDGNGIAEKTETSVRGIDGSLVDTVTFHNNTAGLSVTTQAADGSQSAGIVKTTSADGLIVTTTVGDITTQKTFVAGSNGSYRFTQSSNGLYPIPSASHSVDVNGVDTWTSSYVPDANAGVGPNTTTTIQIDTAKEQAAVAEANGIYQTVLNRPMMDVEQESLVQYIRGGILDQQALAKSLIGTSAAFDLNFIKTSYENDFGHDPSASDLAAYLNEIHQGGAQGDAAVAVSIAEKAVNEQAGNGLLALLPGAPQATPMTVTLISPSVAAMTNTGANYAAFVNTIGKPSGNLTPGQISQFSTLTGNGAANSSPQINFASASSSTSGQGTAVPGFFGGPSEPGPKAPAGGAAGPLVVNLAGAKVHTTDVGASPVKFDFSGSGTANTTGWITPNEGFLVLDPLGAAITNGKSMIPTFGALAQYDLNGDGTLTAAEAGAAGVKIWVDANGDGVDQTGEIESLSQAGIASINLKKVQTGTYDHGNIVAADASFTFVNGTTGDVADAWLAYGGALAQGAVYQFADSAVIRAPDGTASDLLYGTGETVDAGATGLSKIVDTGSNNLLEASSGATVTLSGSTGDHLVGGSGADMLLAVGDGERVQTGSNTNAVYVSGANTTVDASLGTSSISLDGTNDSVTGATSGTTIDVTKGTGAAIAATGSKITIEGGIGAEISGSGDTITAAGRSTITLDASNSTLTSDAASTVSVNGSNDTVSLDRTSKVSVGGTGETIALTSGTVTALAGSAAKVTGNNDFATQAGNSSLRLVGSGGAIDVTGANAVSALDNGAVVLETGSSDTLTGSAAQVVQTTGTTLSLTGTNASIVVTGSGNQSTLSDAHMTIQDGASSQVSGSRDVIAAGPKGLTGPLVGSDNRVTLSGTGAQLTINGNRDIVAMASGQLQLVDGSSATLNGSLDTVILYSGDTLSLNGQNDGVTAYGQNDSVTAYGSSDTVTGDGSNDALSLMGSNGAIVAYGSNTTVAVMGANDTVTADGYQDVVTLNGTGETVTANNSSTVKLLDGSSAVVSGGQNSVLLGANSTLTLNGSGDIVTVSGMNDLLTINGQGDHITASNSGDTINILQSGDVVSAQLSAVSLSNGIGLVVTGTSDAVTLGSNDALNLSGDHNSIIVGGSGDVVTSVGSGDSVSGLGSNATINLSGVGEQVSVGGDVIHLSDGATASLTGPNDTATLGSNGALIVTGTNDAITTNGQNDTATVSGSGDTVTVAGSNDVVRLAHASNTVIAGSQSVVETANGNLSLYGGLSTSAVTVSASTPSATINLGSGNIVFTIAIPGTIDGYAANGLHSWEELYNTLSGALKETDQYQYNSSNALMEIDRYGPSNVKTEADLYDPKTSAEIGSYLYAPNGHVNEVVDLVNSHDWLSQADGSYKDKASGAVSKTQPTLR